MITLNAIAQTGYEKTSCFLSFRHIECNTSKTPGSKRWPALATWILEGVPTNRVDRNAFFLRADPQALNESRRGCIELRGLDPSCIVPWERFTCTKEIGRRERGS